MRRFVAEALFGFLLILGSAAQASAQERFELRGYYFGDPITNEPDRGQSCSVDGASVRRCKDPLGIIAGVSTSFVRHYIDGKLYRMVLLFSPRDLETMLRAISVKYGPPLYTNEEARKHLEGFDNRGAVWSIPGGVMRVDEINATLAMVMADSTALAREADSRLQAAKDSAAMRDLSGRVKR